VLAYVNRLIVLDAPGWPDVFWLSVAFVWALLLTSAAEHIRLRGKLNPHAAARLHLAAWSVATIGLWLYLPSAAWTWGAVFVLLASTIYWRWRRLELAQLAFVGAFCLWVLSMATSVINSLNYTLGLDEPLYWDLGPNLIAALMTSAAGLWVLPHLAGPAFKHIRISQAASIAALAVGMIVAFAHLEGAWMLPGGVSKPMVEGGLTALIAIATALAAWRVREEGMGTIACWSVAGVVGWRIVRFHLFGAGGGDARIIFNPLLLQFGIPLLAALAVIYFARQRGWLKVVKWFVVAAMIIAFLWLTFSVRSFFGVERLLRPISGNAELYTLSLVWLSLAVLLQSIGLWRRSSVLHIGSLVLLLVVVGKVLFVDAANLTGLLRVLSFLVLGVALIGIGYFYNRVVFSQGKSMT